MDIWPSPVPEVELQDAVSSPHIRDVRLHVTGADWFWFLSSVSIRSSASHRRCVIMLLPSINQSRTRDVWSRCLARCLSIPPPLFQRVSPHHHLTRAHLQRFIYNKSITQRQIYWTVTLRRGTVVFLSHQVILVVIHKKYPISRRSYFNLFVTSFVSAIDWDLWCECTEQNHCEAGILMKMLT